MSKMRIVLVDDHEVVRLGLKVLLEQSDHFEVVGEANNAKEAVEITGKFRPDIVLMDIRLPGASGIEACEEITQLYPEVRVVMLTSYAEDEMLFSATLILLFLSRCLSSTTTKIMVCDPITSWQIEGEK